MFGTRELQPGWVPSLPRGRRCSSQSSRLLDRRLPLFGGQSFHPRHQQSIDEGPITRHQRGFTQFTRPAFPSPVAAGWNEPPLGFPPGFAPRRPGADDARRGGDRPSKHGPGTTRSTSTWVDPPIGSSLTTCDLASHDELGERSHDLRGAPAPPGEAGTAPIDRALPRSHASSHDSTRSAPPVAAPSGQRRPRPRDDGRRVLCD